ncbi:hypothetical protein Chor_016096 [Crotalus horridus]
MTYLLAEQNPVNNADFIIPVEIDGVMHQDSWLLLEQWVEVMARGLGSCNIYLAVMTHALRKILSEYCNRFYIGLLLKTACKVELVYVLKRPHVDEFLRRMGELFECVLFTASLAKVPVASWFDNMADTELLDLLPFFERLSKVDDVYTVLKQHRTTS